MKNIQTQIPDFLYNKIEAISVKENISIDQIVSMAISAMIPILTLQEDIKQRAKKGSIEHFHSILNKVPSVEPESYDSFEL